MNPSSLYRLSAFTDQPDGGNCAGVWLGEVLPPAAVMQAIAAEVGFSETAFVAPASGAARQIRYFSPQAEVSFCGHATIAAGALIGRLSGAGTYVLSTAAGEVEVHSEAGPRRWRASLLSVATRHIAPPASLLDGALGLLGWRRDQLDAAIPPAVAYAGAWHLVLATRDADRLAHLEYDFEALRTLMLEHGLTTLQLVRAEGPGRFESRNPFPVGGMFEDAATGAAAAALGGYLRDAGLLAAPARLQIRQGHHMGRPSLIDVEIPVAGGVRVSGEAVELDDLPVAAA
ncbi:PhzF family phenazine biosynthesis protein [Pseudomarimonas salicorniae]|uniref:PhzF family phenazine biosynthesis protein n=1 Tax=Pseudomarimonas salicorniae TaxID=2933270 RepID=A0ABT0GKU2_9GAMM|nr:PhzF family phenazine biosynthesis protein [Lysobacter sp. CAU 1642]MCK7594657.1 PhzF family phenazine biosynthesis protein [Lysobacter sp. CAU 1642]